MTEKTRQQAIEDLVKKIKSMASPEEINIIIDKLRPPSDHLSFEYPTQAVEAFFDLSRKQIAEYVKQGCPKVRYGVYDLKKVYDWRCDNIEVKDGDAPQLIALRGKGLKISNARNELKLNTEKGKLIAKEDILPEWVQVYGEFRTNSLALINLLPPLVAGKTISEIRPIVQERVYALLKALARKGQNRPSPIGRKRKEK